MGMLRLRSTDFRREREKLWRELEIIVNKVEKRGLKSLTAHELQLLPFRFEGCTDAAGAFPDTP